MSWLETLFMTCAAVCLVCCLFVSKWFLLAAWIFIWAHGVVEKERKRLEELEEARSYEPPNIYGDNDYVTDRGLGDKHFGS
jgi:hypothetical protein